MDYNLKPYYFVLHRSKPESRIFDVEDWYERGGVLVLGYDLFRVLTNSKSTDDNDDRMINCLIKPGADLVIFDEGHVLQKPTSQNYKCCNRIDTPRRIILTGTPLQNNLIEYYWMVSFVRPGVLGDLKHYKRLFYDPIMEGLEANATVYTIDFMKRRAYVLQKMLKEFIQRVTNAIYKKVLPPKEEHTVYVRLSKLQMKLYKVNFQRCSF